MKIDGLTPEQQSKVDACKTPKVFSHSLKPRAWSSPTSS